MRRRPAAVSTGAAKRAAAAGNPERMQTAARERLRAADREYSGGPAAPMEDGHQVALLKRPSGRSSSGSTPRDTSNIRGSPPEEEPPLAISMRQGFFAQVKWSRKLDGEAFDQAVARVKVNDLLELELAKHGGRRAGLVVVKVQEKGWVTPEGLCLKTLFVAASTEALDVWVCSLPRPWYVHLCRGTEAHCQYEQAGRPIIHGEKWRRRQPREADGDEPNRTRPRHKKPVNTKLETVPGAKWSRPATSRPRSKAGSSAGRGSSKARATEPQPAYFPPVPEVPGADVEQVSTRAAPRGADEVGGQPRRTDNRGREQGKGSRRSPASRSPSPGSPPEKGPVFRAAFQQEGELSESPLQAKKHLKRALQDGLSSETGSTDPRA